MAPRRIIEDGRTIPVGVRPDRSRPEARLTLPARAVLLLYTDGLVERRHTGLDDGIAEVCALLHEGRNAELEHLASQIMQRLAPSDGYQDDVALLLYRHPAPLQIDFPADVDRLADVRTALRNWLIRAEVNPDQIHDVLIAAGEAVSNSIEHGHRDRPGGLIRLRATVSADLVRLAIVDSGSWKPPRTGGSASPRSGYQPHAGTHAGRHDRSRNRGNHSAFDREDRLMPTSLTLDTARSVDGRLVLTAIGEIDLSNVQPFSQALTTAVADADGGGESRLIVDLSGVEYVDSAAVNVLFPSCRADPCHRPPLFGPDLRHHRLQ